MSRKTTTPALPKPPRAGRAPLAVREILGNLTLSAEGVIAWYVLPAKHYSFLSDGQRENLVDSIALRYSTLVGHRIYLRVTSRPYPARKWAENLYTNTVKAAPANRLPRCAGNTFEDHLATVQQHLHQTTMAEKEVYLGVRISDRKPLDRLGEFLRRSSTKSEAKRLRTVQRQIDTIVAGPGFDGLPATPQQVEFLMHRSVALGLPAPVTLSPAALGGWTEFDMGEFADSVDYHAARKTVEVRSSRGTSDITRHVAVLTVGRMDSVEVPPTTVRPWLQAPDQLRFPVEIAATFDLVAGEDAARRVNQTLLKLRDQEGQFDEHGMEAPLDLARKADQAREIEDQMNDGNEVTSARAYGWVRMAVSGTTEEETLDRVTAVQNLYRPMHITIRHPHSVPDMASQYHLLREFIPGEPLSTQAYRREFPLSVLAAALPTVSAQVGDRVGPYIGRTIGSSTRAVMFDPFFAMEQWASSGVVPIVGTPGSGKSALLASQCYLSARRGISTTVLDPSGPLANIAALPELRNYSRVIDLMRSPEGTLNPYAVIETPHVENYTTGEELNTARLEAERDRMTLAYDVIRNLLPRRVLEHGDSDVVIARAIRLTGGKTTASLFAVMEHLKKLPQQQAQVIAEYLGDMSDMPAARLFFAAGSDANASELSRDRSTLLVITMAGLDLPDRASDDPDTWTMHQRMSVPLLHLAVHYVTRRVYGANRNIRKLVALDEIGQMGNWGSGKALFNRLARDSRKWNVAVLASSQDPADVLGLNIANKTSGAFVGRIEEKDIAEQALDLLGVPTGVGYEKAVANLSATATGPGATRNQQPREFVYRDVFGSVEKIAIDLSHMPDVLQAILTDANPDTSPATTTPLPAEVGAV
jgi:AAA domain-containing protein